MPAWPAGASLLSVCAVPGAGRLPRRPEAGAPGGRWGRDSGVPLGLGRGKITDCVLLLVTIRASSV